MSPPNTPWTDQGEWEDDVMEGMGVLKTQSVEIAGRFHGDDIIDEVQMHVHEILHLLRSPTCSDHRDLATLCRR